MPKIVTKLDPTADPREVSEQEATDLRFMGLLVEPDEATSRPAAKKRAPRKAVAKAPAKPSGDTADDDTPTSGSQG